MDKQGWLIVALYFLAIIISMVLKFWNIYKVQCKKNANSSKSSNFKSAVIVFLKSDMTYNIKAGAVIAMIFVVPFMLSFMIVGEFLGDLLPLIVLKILCIISGIIYIYYFIWSVIDTVKSIKKEKWKTTIKFKWQGVVAVFVLLLFVYAYTS